MKKFTNILFAFAFVLALQAGVVNVTHATGTYDPVVNYAPGYKYDKTKDPSYGWKNNPDNSSLSSCCTSSGSGGGHSENGYKTQNGASTNSSSVNDSIKALLEKIKALQAEVGKTKSEVEKLLKDGLKQGMTDEDIKKIQELLAGDKDIYPEGEITGFFGEKTKEAIKRFQKKHDLEETGEVGPQTKKLLDEYLKEKGKLGSSWKRGGNFFSQPDIKNNIRDKFCVGVGNVMKGPFCKDFKSNHSTSTQIENGICERARFASNSPWVKLCKDHASSTVQSNDNCRYSHRVFCNVSGSNYNEIKVKVVAGTTTVSFKIGTTSHTVVVKSTTQSVVLKAVADKLSKNLSNLNSRFVSEIKKKLEDALKNSDDVKLKKRASEAITRATQTIAAVAADIVAADSDVDTTDAENTLDDANDLLDAAKVLNTAAKYKEARVKAREAEKKADDAADALDDAN